MTTYNTIIQNRRIEIPAPQDLADGTAAVRVDISLPAMQMGISESEWSNEPEALVEWSAWLKTIKPIEFPQADEFDEEIPRLKTVNWSVHTNP